MEGWSWMLIVVALVLLVAGSLRFDLLLTAARERLGGGRKGDAPTPARSVAASHGHAAAAHTGHVAVHGTGRRRHTLHRSGKRH